MTYTVRILFERLEPYWLCPDRIHGLILGPQQQAVRFDSFQKALEAYMKWTNYRSDNIIDLLISRSM